MALGAWVKNGDCIVAATANGKVVFEFATDTKGKTTVPDAIGENRQLGIIVTNPVPSPIVLTCTYKTVDIWYI